MLDACAELLDEVGFEGLSTTRIAERAGVAIGSVYQFFPDKRAIARALTLRYLEMFVARLGRRFMAEEFSDLWQAVDVIIDEYVDMHRTVKGLHELHLNVDDAHLLDSVTDNTTLIAGRLRELLLDEFGLADSEEFDRAMVVAVEAADAVLKKAFRRDPLGDPEIIAELKQLIRRYLAGVLTVA